MAKNNYANPFGFVVTILIVVFGYIVLGTELSSGWRLVSGIIFILLILLRLEIAISGRGNVRL